jgi:hypothetical protein
MPASTMRDQKAVSNVNHHPRGDNERTTESVPVSAQVANPSRFESIRASVYFARLRAP